MRRLMWFSVGFSAACAFTAYIWCNIWLFAVAAMLAAAVLLLRLIKEKGILLRIIAVVLSGMAAGFIWFQLYDIFTYSDARNLHDRTLTRTMRVTDYVNTTSTSNTVKCELSGDDFVCDVLVYAKGIDADPGDLLKGTFTFRYTGTGTDDAPTYHRSEGILLLAYPQKEIVVLPGDSAWGMERTIVELRHGILTQIDKLFDSETAAFAKALLLGETGDLSYKTDTDLSVSGIRHVVAVSGLHVSILLSMVFYLFGKRGLKTLLISIPILLLFAAVAGFSASIVRACIMQILLLLAFCVKREYDAPTALALSVLVLLMVDPQNVTSVGLQLSVASVAGIVAFGETIRGALQKLSWLGPTKGRGVLPALKRYFTASVSVSVSAMITTAPLCAAYFGMVSLIALVTNLLCLWMISFLFVGIMLACLSALLLPAVGSVMALGLTWIIRGLLGVCSLLADIPFAAVYTESTYICIWLALIYLLPVLYWLLPVIRRKWLLWTVPISLCLAIAASWLVPRMDNYRLTVLDVGQGQCVLVYSEGRTYMIDCGGYSDKTASNAAAEQLLSMGITHLDGIVVTHYDKDHIGGVSYLLERVPADQLYLPGGRDKKGYREALISAYGEDAQIVYNTTCVTWDDSSLTMYPGLDSKNDNESGLCILFETEKCAILITGDQSTDGEYALIQNYQIPDVDILIAGHHGAKTSTGWRLLRQLDVKTVVISVGGNNSYGHPSQEVLDRLAACGCQVYRTDLDGTVIIRG